MRKVFAAFAIASLLALYFIVSGKLLNAPVAEYDEGIVLTYSDLWTRGELPNRDFFSNYPPANYWIVGTAFRLFDPSVDVEREVGAFYRLLLIGSVFWLCRSRGNFLASVGAALAFLASTKDGLAAYAWIGAVGLCVGSIAALSAQQTRSGNRTRLFLSILAGLFAGSAALLRVDMPGVGVLVASSVLILRLRRRDKAAYATGWSIGIAPLVVHAFRVGPTLLFDNLFLQPIFHIGPARRLSILAIDHASIFALALTLFFVAVIGAAAVINFSRHRKDPQAVAFASIAIFTFCITPHALARADIPHMMYVDILAMAFAPFAISILLERLGGPERSCWIHGTACAVVVGVVMLFTPCVLPGIQRRGDQYVHAVTAIPNPPGFAANRGRLVPTYGGDFEQVINYVLRVVEHLSKPGDRLYVGCSDLRFASMNDVFFYFLLPQLQHATYFIQNDPGCTNVSGSSLSRDLASADVLILNKNYDNMPNSGGIGSDEPNRIVDSEFKLENSVGPFQIYKRLTSSSR